MPSVITGTGSYIPPVVKTNKDFAVHNFYTEDHQRIETDPLEVVEKFQQITGIEERRYAEADMNASCMGSIAAKAALDDAHCDPETIDQILALLEL